MMLEEKLQQLRGKFLTPEDQRSITEMEKGLRRKIKEQKVAEIDVVKEIIKDAKENVKGINLLLAYGKALTDSEREALFKQRDVYQFWLERFGAWNADQFVEALERIVDEKLKT